MKKIIAIALLLCCSASYGDEDYLTKRDKSIQAFSQGYQNAKATVDAYMIEARKQHKEILKDGKTTKKELEGFENGVEKVTFYIEHDFKKYDVSNVPEKQKEDVGFNGVIKAGDEYIKELNKLQDDIRDKYATSTNRADLSERVKTLQKEVDDLKLLVIALQKRIELLEK